MATFRRPMKAVTVNGTVSAATPWVRYQIGDRLTYNFNFEVTISNSDSAYNVNLSFTSDLLQFPLDSISAAYFTWQYHDAADPSNGETRNDSPPPFTEGVEGGHLWLIFTLLNSDGMSSLQGSFEVDVSDAVMPSDKVSSVMTVTYEDQASGGSSFSSSYVSTFVYIKNPLFEMDSSLFDPDRGIEMGIGDIVDVSVTATFPQARVAPLVEIVGPFNQSATMTFADSMTTSFGANVPCVGCVSQNQLESTSGNLEYDKINAEISEILVSGGDNTDPANEMKLFFNFRLDDHIATHNATERWIMAGIMYGRTHIWVGQMAVTAVVDETERLPHLEAETELMSHNGGQEIYEGDDVTVSVSIWHCGQRQTDNCDGNPSRAIAFDVNLVIILPPFSNFKSVIFWDNLDSEPTVVQIQDTLIKLQLGDLSFSYEPVVKFNITVDPSGETSSLNGSTFVGLVEVVYLTREGVVVNNDYKSVNFEYVKTTTPAPTSTVSVGSLLQSKTCVCPFDAGQSNCACCAPGSVRCDNDFHEMCVKSQESASKCPSPDLYDAGYVLEGGQSRVYVCDASDETLDKDKETCTMGDLLGKWSGVRRSAINVLGVNLSSSALYGLHNDMRSYLMSEDGGVTWFTIPQQLYENAKLETEFVLVERAASGGSQTSGGNTVSGSAANVAYNGNSRLVWTCPTCPQ
ncbi:uncharacterized protein [Ptychodera flava]|uniref:uncharacterized protein isoform X2 n=1 Tax=Ptychodera flava TaxID=63121 RepID=UPI00396A7E0A